MASTTKKTTKRRKRSNKTRWILRPANYKPKDGSVNEDVPISQNFAVVNSLLSLLPSEGKRSIYVNRIKNIIVCSIFKYLGLTGTSTGEQLTALLDDGSVNYIIHGELEDIFNASIKNNEQIREAVLSIARDLPYVVIQDEKLDYDVMPFIYDLHISVSDKYYEIRLNPEIAKKILDCKEKVNFSYIDFNVCRTFNNLNTQFFYTLLINNDFNKPIKRSMTWFREHLCCPKYRPNDLKVRIFDPVIADFEQSKCKFNLGYRPYYDQMTKKKPAIMGFEVYKVDKNNPNVGLSTAITPLSSFVDGVAKELVTFLQSIPFDLKEIENNSRLWVALLHIPKLEKRTLFNNLESFKTAAQMGKNPQGLFIFLVRKFFENQTDVQISGKKNQAEANLDAYCRLMKADPKLLPALPDDSPEAVLPDSLTKPKKKREKSKVAPVSTMTKEQAKDCFVNECNVDKETIEACPGIIEQWLKSEPDPRGWLEQHKKDKDPLGSLFERYNDLSKL